MQLKDVMTTDVEVATPAETVQEAAAQMAHGNIGALPVCAGEHPVGIVTDRDIAIRVVAEGRDPRTTAIRDIMTPSLVCCPADTDAEEAAHVMGERQVRRVLVLDQQHHLAGIVSLGDLAVTLNNEALAGETLEEISQPAA